MKTFILGEGKYEIDVDDMGLVTAVRRNKVTWIAGFEAIQHMGAFHAALAEIERMSDVLQLARNRLADVILDDDGQAVKEARKAMPQIEAALRRHSGLESTPKSPEPIADLRKRIERLAQDFCDNYGIMLAQTNIGWIDTSSVDRQHATVSGVSIRTQASAEPANSGTFVDAVFVLKHERGIRTTCTEVKGIYVPLPASELNTSLFRRHVESHSPHPPHAPNWWLDKYALSASLTT